jgi:CheY-like chemotaxis protein
MLEKLGYHVTGYTQSSAALEDFRKSPGDYDLVITDMTMPFLTGDRLANEIKALRPDIPIILCTGFNEHIGNGKHPDPNIQASIMKPVGMQNLAETLREVLDRHLQERRKDTRYGLRTDTFVISKTDPRKRAEVIDISRSGFSFQYTEERDLPDRFEQLSIRTMDERFALDDISFETVSDTAKEGSGARPSVIRRRGGRFNGLTPVQYEQLSYFIENVAVNMRN